MAGKPMSWKWRLTIAGVVLTLVLIATVFTPVGHNLMRGWIRDYYYSLPPAERAESGAADYWLALAFFVGYICQQDQDALEMYREFLGTATTDKGDFWVRSYDWQEDWAGFFEYDKNKRTWTGWGMMHPRAPEAFYSYIQLYGPTVSDQFEGREAYHYYDLFHEKYRRYAKDGKWLPHPNFYVFWEKMKLIIMKNRARTPPIPMTKPEKYPGPK